MPRTRRLPGQRKHAKSRWLGAKATQTKHSGHSTGMRLAGRACWGGLGLASPQRAAAIGLIARSCTRRHILQRFSADRSVAGSPHASSRMQECAALCFYRADGGLSSSWRTTVVGFAGDAGGTENFIVEWSKPNQGHAVAVLTTGTRNRAASVAGSTRRVIGCTASKRLGHDGHRPSAVARDQSTMASHPVCTT